MLRSVMATRGFAPHSHLSDRLSLPIQCGHRHLFSNHETAGASGALSYSCTSGRSFVWTWTKRVFLAPTRDIGGDDAVLDCVV